MKASPYTYAILLFFALGAISLIANGQSSSLIEAHFKALSRHDINAIASGYADSAEVYSPNWEGGKKGRAGITEVYSRYFKSTPDLSFNIGQVILAGEHIIVEYTQSGTLSNPEDNSPVYMKNKKYSLKCCAIFTIKDGKIAYETDYFDQVAFLRQVGFFDPH
jgi:steroid delta-isomerase-like uncharacterized protein